MRRHTFPRARTARTALAAALAALALAPSPAAASLPGFRLCFGDVINVPGPTFGQPPTINGTVAGDLGWTRSWRYVFQNGTPMVDAAVQGIKDGSNLYLSFELMDDPTFDNADVIVLAFGQPGVPTSRRQIKIFPVHTGDVPAPDVAPREVEISEWDGAQWINAVTNPAWLLNNIRVERISTLGGKTWTVEARIPLGAGANQLNLPAAGDFDFFFELIPLDGNTMTTAAEHHWPTDPQSVVDIFSNPPDAAFWGAATRAAGAGCNGVSLAVSDIFTNNNPPHRILLGGPNVFSARVKNSTVNPMGTGVAANNVSATFKIANFGLPAPNSWQPVPAPGNPVTGNIPAPVNPMTPGQAVLSTGAWVLSMPQQTTYDTPATRHQCILVELDSPDPNTTFVNRSAWRNFDFGWASTFARTAEVGTDGYERPRDGGNQRFQLRPVRSVRQIRPEAARFDTLFPKPDDNQEVPREGKFLSEITQVVKGCRLTGEFLELEGQKWERCENAGAFGFGVRHWGDTPAEWSLVLRGEGLQQAEKGVYVLSVPHGRAATLTTVIEARDGDGREEPTGETVGGTTGPVGGGTGGRSCPFGQSGAAVVMFGLVGIGAVLRFLRRRS